MYRGFTPQQIASRERDENIVSRVEMVSHWLIIQKQYIIKHSNLLDSFVTRGGNVVTHSDDCPRQNYIQCN